MIIRFAWRNLLRNKRRSALTALAIGFSSAVLIFFMSLQLSSYDASINASVKIFQGLAQVQRVGYLDKPQITSAIEDIANLRGKIERLPEVVGAAARAYGFALVSSSTQTFGVQVVGVEPDKEPLVSTIPSLIFEGRYLSSETAQEVVVGEALAKNLALEPGASISIIGQGKDGSVAAAQLTVAGVFRSGTKALDRSVIEMPLGFFQETFSMGTGGHTVVVAGSAVKNLPQIMAEINALLSANAEWKKSLAALDWDKLSPGLKQAIELDMTFGWLFYASLIVIVALSILNTFLMSVLERTKEFGLLLCLGVNLRRLLALVTVECLLLTLLGLVLGGILGAAVVQYYHLSGFSVPGAEEVLKLWNLPASIYPDLHGSVFAYICGLVLLLTSAAILYPLFKIAKIKPLQALLAR